MSSISTDSAGLIQERWADHFSIGSRLVFDKVVGVVGNRKTCVVANLAEFAVGRPNPSIRKTAGRSSSSSVG